MFTLGEAARAVGKTKPALSNAVKSGRLTATRDDRGQYQIDPAELFRVYPQKGNTLGEAKPQEVETLHRENELLREQLGFVRDERERERRQLESQLDDLKADRDHWRKQVTALLTHQPLAVNETPPARLSLWQRLTGKG